MSWPLYSVCPHFRRTMMSSLILRDGLRLVVLLLLSELGDLSLRRQRSGPPAATRRGELV
jgi:hypothetical protein